MYKLKLADLSVESFSTSQEALWVGGTVEGNQQNPNPSRDWACESGLTYNHGCGPTAPCACPSGFTCGYESCMYTQCPSPTRLGQTGCAGPSGNTGEGACYPMIEGTGEMGGVS